MKPLLSVLLSYRFSNQAIVSTWLWWLWTEDAIYKLDTNNILQANDTCGIEKH